MIPNFETSKALDSFRVCVYGITSTPKHTVAFAEDVPLQFRIDPDNGSPIYEQIARQVKYAVAEGTLIPGQLIPSVRELAKSAAINPNTVQRAYLDLQNEEVIEPLRGRGMVVCTGARKRCVSDRQIQLRERLEGLVREAIQSGLDPDPLRQMFEKALSQAISSSSKKGDS